MNPLEEVGRSKGGTVFRRRTSECNPSGGGTQKRPRELGWEKTYQRDCLRAKGGARGEDVSLRRRGIPIVKEDRIREVKVGNRRRGFRQGGAEVDRKG